MEQMKYPISMDNKTFKNKMIFYSEAEIKIKDDFVSILSLY